MKMKRGRNGLTKAEFLQREVDEEVANRVEEALAKMAEKKAKAEEEKCYPAPHGNISVCPKNEHGYCSLFDKKCNNISTIEEGEPK